MCIDNNVMSIIGVILSLIGICISIQIYFIQLSNEITNLYINVRHDKLIDIKESCDIYLRLINTNNRAEIINIMQSIIDYTQNVKELIYKQNTLIKYKHPIMNLLKSETNHIDKLIIDSIVKICQDKTEAKISIGININYGSIDTNDLKKAVINLYYLLYGYSMSGGHMPYSMVIMSIIERNNAIIRGVKINKYLDYIHEYEYRYMCNMMELSNLTVEYIDKYTSYKIMKYILRDNKTNLFAMLFKDIKLFNRKSIKYRENIYTRIKHIINSMIFYIPIIVVTNVKSIIYKTYLHITNYIYSKR